MKDRKVRFKFQKNNDKSKSHSVSELIKMGDIDLLRNQFQLFEQELRKAAADHLIKIEMGEKRSQMLNINVKGELTS
ncbi:hypothetical protein IM538_03875 [Cytobacillus suaedae]|nr:hypothetical protein IM538_03875 [Cytobacillus suaedae]